MSRERFIGYPSSPSGIGEAIEGSVRQFSARISEFTVRSWPQLFKYGEIIDENIFSAIDRSELCLFDITVPNFNVFYEAGYAIGRRKPVIPLINISIENSGKYLSEIGLFDTVGLAHYQNSSDLLPIISQNENPRPILASSASINRSQPVYVLRPKILNERFSRILSGLSDLQINYRTFDPSEDPRMSIRDVLQQIQESTGVLCAVVADDYTDAINHNLRTAFAAGLAYGKDRNLRIVNLSGTPLPLDVRDFSVDGSSLERIDALIERFSVQALASLQSADVDDVPLVNGKKIDRINLGNSAAENEARRLADYFVETPAYRDTIAGHARVVIGRKGSGKTAIFSMASRSLKAGRKSLVLPLKPDGYQLRKFKDQLISLLSEGTKEHTVSAFWEYILLLEICHQCLVQDQRFVGRDGDITRLLPHLRESYFDDPYIQEGDFSERTAKLLNEVFSRVPALAKKSDSVELSREQITDIIYRHDIHKLRKDVIEYLSFKDRVVVLVDNLDKGWEPSGVSSDDLLMLRSLMEAGRKIERELARHDVEGFCVVFLRNDIYELLLERTPDRGKEGKVAIDWTDPDYLKLLLRRRLSASQADAAWSSIATTHVDGSPSIDWVIERSLMRPRYLIDLVGKCLGIAATYGHNIIEESDFRSGYSAYSYDVLVLTNLEVRDVRPEFFDAIFALQSLSSTTTKIEIDLALLSRGFDENYHKDIIDLLVWYGVLGCINDQDEAKYIYQVEYNSHVLEQLRVKRGHDDEKFEINIALWPALSINGKGTPEPRIRLL